MSVISKIFIFGLLFLLPWYSFAKWPEFQYDPNHPFLQSEFQTDADTFTHSQVTYGNQFELLIDAEPSLKKKIELVKSAKETIFITAMIFLRYIDPTIKEFVEILIQKAKEGVEVYVIIDSLNANLDPQMFKKLSRKGVHLGYFNQTLKSDPIPWKIRMHEKYIVVDDAKAVLGGQNLYDERYPFIPKNFMEWRDTDIYVEGPAARMIAAHFCDLWKTMEPSISPPPPEVEEFPPLDLSPEKRKFHISEARFLYNEPYTGQKNINRYYLKLIENAQHHIFWAANQVALNKEFENALKDAARRGVQVTLLTNSFATSWWAPGWYHYYFWIGYRPFRNSKVTLRLYQNRYNHSKIFYVDGVVASIGSFNHDTFSLENDAEITVVSYDRDLNQKVYQQLLLDLEDTNRFWFPF
ncbi:MAG: phosphatidylserine/phosphatidylglycerophosphate/cardiolipin synthase family protein [Deltaproteobacteria bacterium]|nr:phosphatidylserine/phosphatidylglycerophosphate/cardiolipin synthase family protein [Deltaproteobacteria bacterium]